MNLLKTRRRRKLRNKHSPAVFAVAADLLVVNAVAHELARLVADPAGTEPAAVVAAVCGVKKRRRRGLIEPSEEEEREKGIKQDSHLPKPTSRNHQLTGSCRETPRRCCHRGASSPSSCSGRQSRRTGTRGDAGSSPSCGGRRKGAAGSVRDSGGGRCPRSTVCFICCV